jgi:predicted metal-dependent peptidase
MLPLEKAERRVKRAKISLMRNPKFALWSGIMMVGKTTVSDDMPTACTNGRDEIYGREFVSGLDDKELGFVVLHENLHKAFRHLTIWKKLHDEDARLANMACDYVINLILVETDPEQQVIAMPRKDGKVYGLLDKRFKGMHTKQVFDLLKQEQEDGDGDGDGDGGEGFDEHDWDGAQDLTDEAKKELEREVDQALRQGQIAHQKVTGNSAGSMSRELGDLLNPKVDWREMLREFVSSVCNAKDASSWRRVNRRFIGSDIYMPTLIGETVGHIVVGVDTSGSVSQDELTRALTEIKCIADTVNPEVVDLLYWDSSIASHEAYDTCTLPNIVSSTKPKGGGGTDPRCVMQWIEDNKVKPECVIMITDGYFHSTGAWDIPVIWVVTEGGTITNITTGKVIEMEAA